MGSEVAAVYDPRFRVSGLGSGVAVWGGFLGLKTFTLTLNLKGPKHRLCSVELENPSGRLPPKSGKTPMQGTSNIVITTDSNRRHHHPCVRNSSNNNKTNEQ